MLLHNMLEHKYSIYRDDKRAYIEILSVSSRTTLVSCILLSLHQLLSRLTAVSIKKPTCTFIPGSIANVTAAVLGARIGGQKAWGADASRGC